MTLMQWNEAMSVGVEELDEQHRKLVGLINDAYEALQVHDETRMAQLLDDMREYAIIHFDTEEGLLDKCGYPELSAHKFQHAKFNEAVREFKSKQFQNTNLSQIFVFLSRWLASHIMEDDMRYAPYLTEKPEK